ncbi:glycoside hydrolase family 32 protein [Sediminibacillus massiliensis]|uniref:glycoside hydrolase family 32 protein n=1 Tax=Sediminibacillus massiliensis TaxID=1926277 RepID=UPI00098871EE|nr:glycoside hydrolase family 32 protein [Sediminibacillus massiliensis]
MYTLERANNYIKKSSNQVKQGYRHHYHLMAPIGWINDPNGFIYYKGEYHLFYQYYPYKAEWGPMHWGHAKSKDLIKWETFPVALAPDQIYDKDGCFSGTAIEKDGKMYLMYTGHIMGEKDEDIRQVQCIAVSSDGINFEKAEQNPVITEDHLPKNAAPQDFRDPKVIKKGELYFSLIASKAEDGGGQILLYKSRDLLDWEFVSVMLKGEEGEGAMWECPDLFSLDGKDVLIISVEGLPKQEMKFPNTHSVVSIIGKMDWEEGTFHKEKTEELDYGLDFYAPQTITDDSNRRIMTSWMQMWGRNIPTDTENHGWAGAMTLPRELSIKNNHIYQRPVGEIKNYYKNKQSINNIRLKDNSKEFAGLSGEVYALELDLDTKMGKRFELEVRSNEEEKTLITYDCHADLLELNRKSSGVELVGNEKEQVFKRAVYCESENDKLNLEIFVDRASIEVFINKGKFTMTSTIYPKKKADKLKIAAEGEIEIISLNKWDIEV